MTSSSQTDPDNREGDQTGPEYLYFSFGELEVFILLGSLKHPDRLALVIHVVPPPQSGHNATRDVLHRPEIQRKQQNDADKAADEAV